MPPLHVLLGCTLDPVPAELAAHLGPFARSGFLVGTVTDGTPASASGLERHDVIVEVDGVAADEAVLRDALGSGAQLTVLRGGVPRTLSLVAAGAVEPSGFLSAQSLPAVHPLRRLEALANLRESYSATAEDFDERLRALDQETREVRDQARATRDALLQENQARIAEFLVEVQQSTLQRIDQRLAEQCLDDVRGLRLVFGELVPEEDWQEITDSVLGVGEQLRQGSERLAADLPEDLDQRLAQSWAETARRLSSEWATLHRDRIARPFAECDEELGRHRNRIDTRFDERVAKAAGTIEKIRKEVHERVECAVARTQRQLGEKLAHRLRELELPKAGEIEGSLRDVREQIESMAERFLLRTERALESYENRVDPANGRLRSSCETAPAALASQFAMTSAELDRVLSDPRDAEVATENSWRARSAITDLRHELGHLVRGPLHVLRDGALLHQESIRSSFQQHRTVTEEAWSDLESALCRIAQEAANDCWKLDGPHLDGRFPAPVPQKRRADIVLSR